MSLNAKILPEFRRFGRKGESFLRDRMVEGQTLRVECYPGGEYGPAPVFTVPLDRIPQMGELQADLMFAPRLEPNLDERTFRRKRKTPEVQDRFPRRAALTVFFGRVARDVTLSVAFVLFDQVAAGSLGGDTAVDRRQVDLFDRMGAELLVETIGRLRGTCENDHARNRNIESADHPQVDVSRLMVLRGDIGLGTGQEGFFPFGKPHRGNLNRLVEHKQVIVFVEDVKHRGENVKRKIGK